MISHHRILPGPDKRVQLMVTCLCDAFYADAAKATVEVLAATPEEIRFEANGRKGAIKFRDLSEISREAVLEYAKERGVLSRFPRLDVQVKVVNQRRNHDSVWYKKTSRLSSSVVITGTNQMTTIPAAEAAMRRKRAEYFDAGTLVVWDVDLLSDDPVRVYRASDPDTPTIYRRGEMAEAEPAVPGWRMPVDEIFE